MFAGAILITYLIYTFEKDVQTWEISYFDEENRVIQVKVKKWIFGSKNREIFNVKRGGCLYNAVWGNGKGLSYDERDKVTNSLILYNEKRKIWKKIEKDYTD